MTKSENYIGDAHEVSYTDRDDVQLNVGGGETKSKGSGSKKLKWFIVFLAFQLIYTFVIFEVFFSPKSPENVPQSEEKSSQTNLPIKPIVSRETLPQQTEKKAMSTQPIPTEATTVNSTTQATTSPSTNSTATVNPQVAPEPVVARPAESPSVSDPVKSTDSLNSPTNSDSVTTSSSNETASIPFDFTKVASYIDTRQESSMVPVILHFAAVLGDDWPFHIFYSPENLHYLTSSAAIQKHVESGRFKLTQLPEGTTFTTRKDITKLLTDRWIWDALAPASHVLMFQLDSMICGNANVMAEDFFQYDFVGAPWDQNGGGNGGLSIRRREKILEVIEKWPIGSKTYTEDIYFNQHLKELPGANLPPASVSQQFSVQTMWASKPFGFDQPYKYWTDKASEVESYCPETKLTSRNYI